MLSCQRKPVTKEEAGSLKNWLTSPHAIFFRELVLAEIAAQQVKAINAEVESLEFPNMMGEHANAMSRIGSLRTFMRELDEFTKDPSKMALTDLIVIHPKL